MDEFYNHKYMKAKYDKINFLKELVIHRKKVRLLLNKITKFVFKTLEFQLTEVICLKIWEF